MCVCVCHLSADVVVVCDRKRVCVCWWQSPCNSGAIGEAQEAVSVCVCHASADVVVVCGRRGCVCGRRGCVCGH